MRRKGGFKAAGPAALAWPLLLGFAAFWPVILRIQTFMPQLPGVMPAVSSPGPAFLLDPMDTTWQNYPLARVNRAAWSKGGLPLWNPLSGCGEPLVFSGVGAVTSPLRAWTALVSAGPASWDYFLVLRLVFAGILAWLWASSLSLSAAASAGTAAVFMLSGHMVLNLNQAFLDAEVMLPALALGVVFLGSGKLRAGWVLSALSGGAILLSGQPQSALTAAGFAAVLLGSMAVRSRGGRAMVAWAGVSAGLAALCLGAPVVFGIAGFLGRAHHMHAGQGTAHEPLAGALSLVAPWIFGEFGGKWLGMNPFHFLPYLGVSAILAAFLGIRRALSHPAGPALVLVPAFLLAAAYGIPPVSWLTELPWLRDVWWSKYQGPGVLCVAALAGFGIQAVWEFAERRPGGRRGLRRLFVWALPVLAAAELIRLMPSDRPAPSDPLRPAPYVEFLRSRVNPLDERVYGTGRVLMPHTGAALGIPDARTYFALYPRRAYRYLRSLLTGPAQDSNFAVFTGSRFAFPALSSPALDILAARWIITTSCAGDLAEALSPESGPMWLSAQGRGRSGRLVAKGTGPLGIELAVPAAGAVLTAVFASGGGPFDLLARVSAPDAPDGEFLLRADGRNIRWQPVKLRLYPWAGKRVSVTFSAGESSGGWGLVSDLLLKSGDGDGARVLDSGGRVREGLSRLVLRYDREVLVYENTSARPRASVVEGAAPARGPEFMPADAFPPGRRFIFAEGKADWMGFVAASKAMPARVVSDAGKRVVCEVPGDGIRVLFLADTWEPGWRAFAGRTRLRVLPAEGMFRAVAVPPGEKRVVFSYEPLSFKSGLFLSGVGAGFCIAVLLFSSGFFPLRTRSTIRASVGPRRKA